jgi:co-chaperonin GroES (HSP10)
VEGYSIKGRALSYDEPIPDVGIFMYGKTKDGHKVGKDIKNHPLKDDSTIVALRETKTDANGNYEFKNVKNGDYVLAGFYSDNTVIFQIEPTRLDASVSNDITLAHPSF